MAHARRSYFKLAKMSSYAFTATSKVYSFLTRARAFSAICSRFGELVLSGGRVVKFEEKPQLGTGVINGGFFVFTGIKTGKL